MLDHRGQHDLVADSRCLDHHAVLVLPAQSSAEQRDHLVTGAPKWPPYSPNTGAPKWPPHPPHTGAPQRPPSPPHTGAPKRAPASPPTGAPQMPAPPPFLP